jgi:hypothetical protein
MAETPDGLVIPSSALAGASAEPEPEWQLRFPPPMIELARDRSGFEFCWSQIQFAFDLSDPRSFRAFPDPFIEAELAVLRRYLKQARELAGSAVLNAGDAGMHVTLTPDGVEEVETTWPPTDSIVGFATMFRQFYADDEEASFNAAQAILFPAAQAEVDDETNRVEELRRWGRAVGISKEKSIDRSAHEALAAVGMMPPLEGNYPDRDKPARVISQYFYGDYVHWSSKKGHSETVARREQSPFDDASYRYEFLKATIGLAHLYLGYGEVIRVAADLT